MGLSPSTARPSWLKGGLFGWAQLVVGAVSGLLLARLAVNFLPKTESGIWFVFLSFAGLVALMDFGLAATLSRELAFKDDALERAKLLSTAERTLRRIIFWAWLVLAAFGGLYVRSITPEAEASQVLGAWLAFVIGAGFLLHANVASSTLYGTGHLVADRQIKILTNLVGLGLAFVLLELWSSLWVLCIAWTLQNLLLWGLSWWAVSRLIQPSQQTFDAALSRKLLGLGLRWWLMAVGGYLILSTDNLVIAGILGPDKVSDYALIARLCAMIQPFSTVFVISILPTVSKLSTEGRLETIRSTLFTQMNLVLTLVLSAGAVLASVPGSILQVWVGAGHFVGYPILIAFLVLLTLEAHHVALASMVMATGRLPFALWAIGAGLLNILFSILFAQVWGLFGVALATVGAQLLTNNWFVPYYALREFEVGLEIYFRKVILGSVAFALLVYGVGIAVGELSQGASPLVRVLGVAVVTGLLCVFRLVWIRNMPN